MRELAEAINHHLRTPLAAILGHAELLLDRRHELPSPLEGSAAGIVRAGARLDDAVSAVCDLVELACGWPGDVERVDVGQLLADEVATRRVAPARVRRGSSSRAGPASSVQRTGDVWAARSVPCSTRVSTSRRTADEATGHAGAGCGYRTP